MAIKIREFEPDDLDFAIEIWNQVVIDGMAFPQTDLLDKTTGFELFTSQSYTGIAIDTASDTVVGLYILHPNNVGRCGHICNASYAVKRNLRGNNIGEKLVSHCLIQAKILNFSILQFNAVVANNHVALNLYKKLGFTRLGTIPKGFLTIDGVFEDIVPHYIEL
ncbi:MAG: GNAT family N-acetyltransferase [Clostridia bacterium]